MYTPENMRLMGGIPGQQLFLYRTADEIEDVVRDGYFNDAIDCCLNTGDIVIATTGTNMAASVDILVISVHWGMAFSRMSDGVENGY